MKPAAYLQQVHDLLTSTPAAAWLTRHEPVVVFERYAMGGGGTAWYRLTAPSDLADVEQRMRPGSLVTFFFRGPFRLEPYSDAVIAEIEGIARDTGEVVAGWHTAPGVELAVDYLVGSEVRAYFQHILPAATVFFGRFPRPDEDGPEEVTVQLPDLDGVVRPHPY